jgi:hypothetical protein
MFAGTFDIVLVFFEQRGQTQVGFGEIGIQVDGRPEGLDGASVVPGAGKGQAQEEVSCRIVISNLESVECGLGRRREFSPVEGDAAESEMGAGLIGIQVQDGLVRIPRVCEMAEAQVKIGGLQQQGRAGALGFRKAEEDFERFFVLVADDEQLSAEVTGDRRTGHGEAIGDLLHFLLLAKSLTGSEQAYGEALVIGFGFVQSAKDLVGLTVASGVLIGFTEVVAQFPNSACNRYFPVLAWPFDIPESDHLLEHLMRRHGVQTDVRGMAPVAARRVFPTRDEVDRRRLGPRLRENLAIHVFADGQAEKG